MTDVNLFFLELSQSISKKSLKESNRVSLDPAIQHNFYDCSYVLDLSEGEMKHLRGFDTLLGFDEGEMDLAKFFDGIHPDDAPLVQRVICLAILHSMENPDPKRTFKLMITFRLRNKFGKYIRVLNKAEVLGLDQNSTPIQLMVHLKNISFMDQVGVQWDFVAADLNRDEFFNEVYEPYRAFFTQRELDIIKELAQGITNTEIGGNLCISPQTVATHRKNILKKAQCHTAKQLIKLCKSMGILSPNTHFLKIPS